MNQSLQHVELAQVELSVRESLVVPSHCQRHFGRSVLTHMWCQHSVSLPPLLSQQVHLQCSTSTVLQLCIRARVAARPPQACLESLYQPISKQHLLVPPSHWHRAYLNSSRWWWPHILFSNHFTLKVLTVINNEYYLSAQVTIQVQEVELGGVAQRQAAFLSTPGHRVLGKQLSADNAETHRWPHPSRHHVPWQRPNPPNNTNGLFPTVSCLFFSLVVLLSMTFSCCLYVSHCFICVSHPCHVFWDLRR